MNFMNSINSINFGPTIYGIGSIRVSEKMLESRKSIHFQKKLYISFADFCRIFQEISHFPLKLWFYSFKCFCHTIFQQYSVYLCSFFLPYFLAQNYHIATTMCIYAIAELCNVDLVWMLLFMFISFMYLVPITPRNNENTEKKHSQSAIKNTSIPFSRN